MQERLDSIPICCPEIVRTTYSLRETFRDSSEILGIQRDPGVELKIEVTNHEQDSWLSDWKENSKICDKTLEIDAIRTEQGGSKRMGGPYLLLSYSLES